MTILPKNVCEILGSTPLFLHTRMKWLKTSRFDVKPFVPTR